MSLNDLTALLIRFRDVCLRQYPDDIETTPRAERDKRLGLDMHDNPLALFLIGVTTEPIEDICRLAKTPRWLKLILRTSYWTWENLHGEIDFDDLLVANTLRFAAPGAFDFLLDNHLTLRSIVTTETAERKDRLKDLEDKWIRTAERASWDAVSAKSLAQFLFPCWKDANTRPPIQGVQVLEPTDYWKRFREGELEPGSLRDQEVLKCLATWVKDPVGAVFRGVPLPTVLCTNEAFASSLEQFAALFLTGIDIRQLASLMFVEALTLRGAKAEKDSVPGFIPLWRRAIRQPIDQKKHMIWVQGEIFKALPKSFRFANDLYHYWSDNSQADIHHKGNRSELRAEVVKRVRKLFEGRADDFVEVLDPDYMYTSYHFCVHFSSAEQGGAGFKASDWPWFSELLLQAGQISPQAVIPQIVPFLVNEQDHDVHHEFSYTFNEVGAREFFGDDLSLLMRLLSTGIDLDPFDVRERKRIRIAHETATRWLRDIGAQPSPHPSGEVGGK